MRSDLPHFYNNLKLRQKKSAKQHLAAQTWQDGAIMLACLKIDCLWKVQKMSKIVLAVEKIHFPSTTNQKCREVPFPFFAVRCTRPNEWTETMASFLLLSEISCVRWSHRQNVSRWIDDAVAQATQKYDWWHLPPRQSKMYRHFFGGILKVFQIFPFAIDHFAERWQSREA